MTLNALIFHKHYKLNWCPLLPLALSLSLSLSLSRSLSLCISAFSSNQKLWLGAKDNVDILNFINQSAKENGPPAPRHSSMWEDRASVGQSQPWVCQYKQFSGQYFRNEKQSTLNVCFSPDHITLCKWFWLGQKYSLLVSLSETVRQKFVRQEVLAASDCVNINNLGSQYNSPSQWHGVLH